MKESELYRIAEAVVLRDSLSLYMNKTREQSRITPDLKRNGVSLPCVQKVPVLLHER